MKNSEKYKTAVFAVIESDDIDPDIMFDVFVQLCNDYQREQFVERQRGEDHHDTV